MGTGVEASLGADVDPASPTCGTAYCLVVTMSNRFGATLRRLRYTDDGKPVWGVRLTVRCGCGASYQQLFVVGVQRPYTFCPRCRTRQRLSLGWDLSGPLREGQQVNITLRADR